MKERAASENPFAFVRLPRDRRAISPSWWRTIAATGTVLSFAATMTLPRTDTAYPYGSWEDAVRVAKQHFDITEFRPGQRELFEAVMAGRDAVGIMPTGGGKSLVYQLASLFLDKPVVVISPLLALMRDQTDKLDGFDVPGVRIDSTLRAGESRDALARVERGHLDLLFLTPEALRRDEVRAALQNQGVALFVIDEAHCVSSWGHDFRPAYLELRDAFELLGRPPVLALTATATKAVEEDLVAALALREPKVVRASTVRPNLDLFVARTASEEAKRATLQSIVEQATDGVGIVYTSTVKRADELWGWLRAIEPSARRYHGKLTAAERRESQAAFMDGSCRVIVATKAFGMGIDKPDVRYVVHEAFPDSVEAYVQEAGRAGRDGRPARATLMYRLEDRRVQEYFLRGKYASKAEIKRVLAAWDTGARDVAELAKVARVTRRKIEALLAGGLDQALEQLAQRAEARRLADRDRLRGIMKYAEHVGCRWEQVLAHFGEEASGPCRRCDVCQSLAASEESTQAAE